MQQYIDSLYQQKGQEGFAGKELVKVVIKECAKGYKHDFPNGGNPLTATVFMSIENQIYIEAKRREIDISREDIIAETVKVFSSL